MPEFQPIEKYDVDPSDRLTRGRLLHAAARGDKRAKLTLDEHRRSHPAPEPDPTHSGSVAAGREMHAARTAEPGGDAA